MSLTAIIDRHHATLYRDGVQVGTGTWGAEGLSDVTPRALFTDDELETLSRQLRREEAEALAEAEACAFDEQGVDLTLVRWMLSLTPAQRLDALESSVVRLYRPAP